MLSAKSNYMIRTGLFLTALSWVTFTFYEFVNAITHVIQPNNDNPVWTWLVLQETGGTVGLGLRTAGGLIAVIACLFYLVNDLNSRKEKLTLWQLLHCLLV